MLKTIRKIHFFIGVLFAPTIVFFAVSGALQILRLHESSGGEPPNAWIAKMGQIHKDQIVGDLPRRKPRPAPAAETRPGPAPAADARPPEPQAGPHRSTPLVIWFLFMAVGLLVSTGLGIYLAFAYKHSRIVIASLLGAGTLIPLISMLM